MCCVSCVFLSILILVNASKCNSGSTTRLIHPSFSIHGTITGLILICYSHTDIVYNDAELLHVCNSNCLVKKQNMTQAGNENLYIPICLVGITIRQLHLLQSFYFARPRTQTQSAHKSAHGKLSANHSRKSCHSNSSHQGSTCVCIPTWTSMQIKHTHPPSSHLLIRQALLNCRSALQHELLTGRNTS